MKITIDHNDISAGLTNFPVLIYISDSSGINNEDLTFIFDEVGANSLKIAVTEDDGTTECYVEVEKWDLGNENAWLWTKIPSISNTTNTDFYLYYDNDHADNIANVGATGSAPAQAVWDGDFAAVWHMGSGAGNEVDSTGNGHTLTEFGQIDQIAGQIGYARDFLGSADYFEYADADLGIGASSFTVESWFLNDADDGRLLYTYNPTSGIFTSTKNPLGGSFDVSATIFVAGAFVEIQSAGDRPYNDDIWYYMVYTRDNADDLELLMDNVQVDTGTKAGSIDGGGHGHVGVAFTHGAEFDGIIDELRVSTVFRSPSWKKASYETGRDDLLDWGSELSIFTPSDPNLIFGAGFNSSSPYVELHWNHSSEYVQFFEVQNSSDGISWDYLGQTTTANYTDTQVLNGTERYYRIRACNQTDGDWYNSSFTTINFEKVYFISEVLGPGPTVIQNVTGEWVYYNLTSINVTFGTHDTGTVNSTLDIDGDTWNCSEVVGAPGYRLKFNWTDVDPDASCLWVVSYVYYDGVSAHVIDIELYNFTSSAWVEIGNIVDMTGFEWVNSSIYDLRMPNDFINSTGAVLGRFNHVSAGNINDDIHVEFLKLYAFIPFEDEAVTVESFFWIPIAIVLSIIAGLLVWLQYEHN